MATELESLGLWPMVILFLGLFGWRGARNLPASTCVGAAAVLFAHVGFGGNSFVSAHSGVLAFKTVTTSARLLEAIGMLVVVWVVVKSLIGLLRRVAHMPGVQDFVLLTRNRLARLRIVVLRLLLCCRVCFMSLVLYCSELVVAVRDSIKALKLIIIAYRRIGVNTTRVISVDSVPLDFVICAPQDLPIAFSYNYTRLGKSYFERMFPNNLLNCYLRVLPRVRSLDYEAADFLGHLLPNRGPMIARDLGYLLAKVVADYDLKKLLLPTLSEKVMNRIGFLHFEDNGDVPAHLTIARLLEFDGYIGASMDPMQMVNTAAAVGAVTIASQEATNSYRAMMNAYTKVRTILNDDEQYIIRKERKHVRFYQDKVVTNDHPLMTAYREIIRDDYEKIAETKDTTLRTLILGATTREYKLYNANKHVYYQFATREGKDTDRFVIECLKSLRKTKGRKVKTSGVEVPDIQSEKPTVVDIETMLDEWRFSRKLPPRFLYWKDTEKLLNAKSTTNSFDVLVFQDVGYNFTKEDWGKYFRVTGATVAYGYMCLPWELIEPNVLNLSNYVYRTVGNESHFAYNGYANGYVHKTDCWKTLMTEPVMQFYDFSLGVEFITRVGPMTTIKIYKTYKPEKVVRHLAIPKYLKTVRVLQFSKSFSERKKELDHNNLIYFSVAAEEFHEAVNYGLDIAKESVNINNLMLYVRRRTSSISLVNKEIAKVWSLSKAHIGDFALVVYLYVLGLLNRTSQYESYSKLFRTTAFSAYIRKVFNKSIRPLDVILDFFHKTDIQHLLVLDVEDSFWQSAIIKIEALSAARGIVSDCRPEDGLDPNLELGEDHDDFTDTCLLCSDLKESLGKQMFTCGRQKPEQFFHDFGLSDEELNRLRMKLSETAGDTFGIRTVKELALAHLPTTSFYTTVKVQYICGPPGSGKSYAIRALATERDLVVAPFSRLKEDYTDFIHPVTKRKTSLTFMTQHTACSASNRARIFVDEYTAMPYELLATIVHNCSAFEVFLVGDHRQTSLINEVEGVAITTKIDISQIREHELVINFRNPKDCVDVLNTWYGYNMIASNRRVGYSFATTMDYKKYPNHTPLFFKHSTAARFAIENSLTEKVTVRANQGATYDNVKLVVTTEDQELFNMPSMAIVALSRHKLSCVILYEQEPLPITFINKIKSAINNPAKKDPTTGLSPIFSGMVIGEVNMVLNDPDPTTQKQKEPEFTEAQEMSNSEMLGMFMNVPPDSAKKEKLGTKAPDRNICLLQSLATLTGNTVNETWRSMVAAIGLCKAKELHNRLWSTDELYSFCSLNNMQVGLTQEGDIKNMILYGPGRYIGEIHYSKAGVGHFYTTVQPGSATRIPLNGADIFSSEVVTEIPIQTDPPPTDQNKKVGDGEDTKSVKSGEQPKTTPTKTKKNNRKKPPKTQPEDTGDADYWRSIARDRETYINRMMAGGYVHPVGTPFMGPTPYETYPPFNNMYRPNPVYNPQYNWGHSPYGQYNPSNFYTPPYGDPNWRPPSMNMNHNVHDQGFMGHYVFNNQTGLYEWVRFEAGPENPQPHDRPSGTNPSRHTSRKGSGNGGGGGSAKQTPSKQSSKSKHSNRTNPTQSVNKNTDDEDLGTQSSSAGAPSDKELDIMEGLELDDSILVHSSHGFRCIEVNTFITNREMDAIANSAEAKYLLDLDTRTIFSIKDMHCFMDNDDVSENYTMLSNYLTTTNFSISRFREFLLQCVVPAIDGSLDDEEVQIVKFNTQIYKIFEKFKERTKVSGGSEVQIKTIFNYPTVTVKDNRPNVANELGTSFTEKARLFTNEAYLKKILVESKPTERELYRPIEQTSFDCFKMLVHDFVTIDEDCFVITNQESLGHIDKVFGNGVFDVTILDRLNQRLHPKTKPESFYSLLNVSPGVTYFKSNLPQSLYCMQSRYLTKAYMVVYTYESEEKAREIADLFFNEHMLLNHDIFNEQDVMTTTLESEHTMKVKNYHKQVDFDMVIENEVRFTMKDIFKPFKTKIDLFKAGQGISAWSRETQSIFQTPFRVINKHFISCLLPHVVYDNGIDEETLIIRVNQLMDLLPDVAMNGVIDATACDSGQNRFTQMIERRILERLDIKDDFLNWYYELRKEYILKGYGVRAGVKDIKTSGEPATLLNNTILMACLMNYVLRGEGPAILVIKGDDGLKRQCNLKCNQSTVKSLKRYMKMEFKVDIDVPITFCGYFLAKHKLIPDLIRKVFKILGHKFHDYFHFTEYQQSLRDWILITNKLGISEICAITAANYGLQFEYCYSLLQSIVSLSHINERQFYKFFKLRTINLDEEFKSAQPWKQKLPWYKGDN